MGYYITIVEEDLKCEKNVSAELKALFDESMLFLPWYFNEGQIRPDEGYFKWSSDFLKDLLILRGLGVRDHLTAYGEEGEYYRYEIGDDDIKEYYGSVKFPKKPEKIIKTEEDLKKYEF